jgi:pimeloyl-ACP methyl ester carboxylesterase
MRPDPVRLALAATILGLAAAVPTRAQESAVRHEYATVNGVRLHYARQGSGELIVFLHGFPEFWYAWKDQLQEFGRDHLAVAPDMRGYNLSDKPAALDQYRVPAIVEDIRALAASVNGGKPFILVGHDWGGVIAWALAISHPEVVRKLVIVNAPHPTIFNRELDRNPAQQVASRYMLFFRSPAAESTLAAHDYASLVGIFDDLVKTGKVSPADVAAYREAWSRPGALTGGLNYYRAARVGPPVDGKRDSLAIGATPDLTVRVPTLVIWGEKDTALLTGNLDGLDQVVPDLTIERVPNGSHWVVHEEPERVAQAIRRFLAR